MFDRRDDFPPPYESALRPIGSYGLDTGTKFVFSVDHDGFNISKEYGEASVSEIFNDYCFWPSFVFWETRKKRLSKILEVIPEQKMEESSDDIIRRISWHYGDIFADYLKEENAAKPWELRALWEKWKKNLEVTIRIGPITCPKADNPEYSGLEIYFDSREKLWCMNLASDGDIPDTTYHGESISAEYFPDLLARKEEIQLNWDDAVIKKTLIDADPRWRRFISARAGRTLRPKRQVNNARAIPIEVDFMDCAEYPLLNNLGITRIPALTDSSLDTNLPADVYIDANLERLRKVFKTAALVSLLDDDDYRTFTGTAMDISSDYARLSYWKKSIFDGDIPAESIDFASNLETIIHWLKSRHRMVIHCKEGLERSHLVAACLVVVGAAGRISPRDAINLVRKTYGEHLLRDAIQIQFIGEFGDLWIEKQRRFEFLAPQQEHAEATREKILMLSWRFDDTVLYRFKASDGNWYYFCRNPEDEEIQNYDDEEYEPGEPPLPPFEPYESLTAALANAFSGARIFNCNLESVREDHVEELMAFANAIIATMDEDLKEDYSFMEPFTAEYWMRDGNRF